MSRYTLDQMTIPAIAGVWSCAFEQSRLARWPAIRVRRDSDNDERDIWFRAGRLDVAGLLSFCGAASGFVVTAYDRTINRFDLSQASTSLQPIIVNAGALVTSDSGQPAMDFATGRYLSRADAMGLTGGPAFTVGAKYRWHTTGSPAYPLMFSIGSSANFPASAGATYHANQDSVVNNRVYVGSAGDAPDFNVSNCTNWHYYVARIAAGATVSTGRLRQDGTDCSVHSTAGSGAAVLNIPNQRTMWAGSASGGGVWQPAQSSGNCLYIFNADLSGGDLTALERGLAVH